MRVERKIYVMSEKSCGARPTFKFQLDHFFSLFFTVTLGRIKIIKKTTHPQHNLGLDTTTTIPQRLR